MNTQRSQKWINQINLKKKKNFFMNFKCIIMGFIPVFSFHLVYVQYNADTLFVYTLLYT